MPVKSTRSRPRVAWYVAESCSVEHSALLADPIRRPSDAVPLVAAAVADPTREHFLAVYLDSRHRPVEVRLISLGSANASIVHPREVFAAALRCARPVAAVLFAHNHPSGDPGPSDDDITITRRLRDAGELLGVQVVDSIILAGDPVGSVWVSLAEQGLL